MKACATGLPGFEMTKRQSRVSSEKLVAVLADEVLHGLDAAELHLEIEGAVDEVVAEDDARVLQLRGIELEVGGHALVGVIAVDVDPVEIAVGKAGAALLEYSR